MAHFLSPGITNRYTSHKWIHHKEERGLVVEDVNCVFSLVRNDYTNLISIFGRARQGKSFLMNCLAGEREIFKVSNEKESCTQGIDISNKWLPLKNFSTIDGGTEVYTNMPTKIGFVDAEGQGDRDITYDANLVCPILLASKCVIFNWKGDLQKDHILSTLGIMTRAAKNVADETAASSSAPRKKKFGHLHICFRDWQAAGTTEKSVFQALFTDEQGGDAAIRNQIRKDIMQNFESVSVWLFEAPVDSTKQLKEKLTYQQTSHSFKTKLRMLRNMLSAQLRDPTIIASRELTGQTMGMFVKQIASALNNGESIMPSSAYKAMMTQEIHKVVSVLQSSIAEKMHFIESELAVLATNPSGTNRVFPNEMEARQAAEHAIDEVMSKYSAKIQSVFGDGKCKLSNDLSKDLPGSIEQMKSQSIQQFMNAHQAHLANYAAIIGQWAEERLYHEFHRLESDDAECMDGENINKYLVDMFNEMIHSMGGVERYQSSIWVNRLESLRMVFMTGKDKVASSHIERYAMKQNEAHKTLSFAQGALLECMQTSMKDLVQTRPQGFPKQDIVDRMNCKYRELKAAVQETVPERNCMYAYILEELRNLCKQLQTDLHEEYASIRKEAFDDCSRNLMHDISIEAEAFKSDEMFETTLSSWSQENFNSLDPRNLHRCREKLDYIIQQIYDILVSQNKEEVADWDDLDNHFDTLVEIPAQKFVFGEFGKARKHFLQRLDNWKSEQNDQLMRQQHEDNHLFAIQKEREQQEILMSQLQLQSQSQSRRQSFNTVATPTSSSSSYRRVSVGGVDNSGISSGLRGHQNQGLSLASLSPALRRSTFVQPSPMPSHPYMGMTRDVSNHVDNNVMFVQRDEVDELRDTIYEARMALADECAQSQFASVSSPLPLSRSNRNTPVRSNLASSSSSSSSSAQPLSSFRNTPSYNASTPSYNASSTPSTQRAAATPNTFNGKSPHISSSIYSSAMKDDTLLDQQIQETVRLFSSETGDQSFGEYKSNSSGYDEVRTFNGLTDSFRSNSNANNNDMMNVDDNNSNSNMYDSAQKKDQYIEIERQKAIEYAMKMGFVMPDDYGSVKKGAQKQRRSTISTSGRSSGYGQGLTQSQPLSSLTSSLKCNGSIDRFRCLDKENARNII